MRIDSRESFAIGTPIFIARQADSPESLEFLIRANHATKYQKIQVGQIKVRNLDAGGGVKVDQKYTNSYTFDLLSGTPVKPAFGPTFDLHEFSEISGPLGGRTRATKCKILGGKEY